MGGDFEARDLLTCLGNEINKEVNVRHEIINTKCQKFDGPGTVQVDPLLESDQIKQKMETYCV